MEERKVVKELFWPYLKFEMVAELEDNWKAVLDKLRLCDKVWFQTIYVEKESQLIICYIR